MLIPQLNTHVRMKRDVGSTIRQTVNDAEQTAQSLLMVKQKKLSERQSDLISCNDLRTFLKARFPEHCQQRVQAHHRLHLIQLLRQVQCTC